MDRAFPEFAPHLQSATTEPLMFVIENGALTLVRFGPLDAQGVIDWIGSEST